MKTRFQRQLTEARRAQILEAAIAVIAEQGFQRTTIKQIAAKAEVADGTIYNYFKNKEAILMAIIGYLTEAETRDLHFDEARQMAFPDFVQEYVSHRMGEIDEGFPLLKIVLTETLANPTLGQQVYDQVYAPSFAVAEAFFAQLTADGTLPQIDVAILSRLFAAPLLGLLLLRMLGDDHVGQNWNAYTDLLAQNLAKMFAAESVVQANEPDETDKSVQVIEGCA